MPIYENFEEGKRLTAEWVRTVTAACKKLERMRGSGGIDVHNTPGGITIGANIPDPGDSIFHFELAEDLTLGSSAEAKLLKLEGSSWVEDEDADAIQVQDWYTRTEADPSPITSPGMWSGKEGMRGLCIRRGTDATDTEPPRDVYDIVWMEQLASWIEWVAIEDMSETEALAVSANVLAYDHQGINPAPVLAEDEETIFVYDPFGEWPDVVTGSKGHALYDYSMEQYHIIHASRVCLFATATLSSTCCGSDSTATVTGFTALQHGEFFLQQSVDVITVYNDWNHSGKNGDVVLLMRTVNDHISGDPIEYRWQIINVEKHETTEVVDYRWNVNQFEMKKRTVWRELCEEEPEWEIVVEAKECTEEDF